MMNYRTIYYSNYASSSLLLSTHFFGPLANWGIPIAAITDIITKEPK